MDNLEEIKILIETNYNLSVEKVSNITSKSLKVSTAQHEYVLKLAEGNDEFITYGNKYIPCESDGQCAVRLIRAYDETHRDDKNTQNIKVNRKEI